MYSVEKQLTFWLLCLRRGWSGSFDLANAWAPLVGALALGLLVLLFGGERLAVPEGVLGPVGFAVLLVVICWVIFVVVRVALAPAKIHAEKAAQIAAYEEAAKPKLEIAAPRCFVEPKESKGKAFRTWRLEIVSISDTTVKNCRVKMASFVNRLGQQADSIGTHFKLSREQPRDLLASPLSQTFDVTPRGRELIDIACLDETNPDSAVMILYATQGKLTENLRNMIPRHFFPHTLVVHVGADNLAVPVERTYSLHIKDGLLCLDEIFDE